MSKSRVKSVFNNFSFGLIRQILLIVFKFILQTIFIKKLGVQYLGVNGLFNDILMYLAMTELGFGASMAVALYTSIAKSDDEKIKQYLSFFRKIYIFIGVLFIVLGLSVLPFLNYFIKSSTLNLNYNFIFIIVLFNAAFPYFYFPNIQFLFINEKQHIIDKRRIMFDFILILSQCISLLLFQNYYIYLILQFIITILLNLSLNYSSKHLYPILSENCTKDLEKDEKKSIIKKTIALFSNSISSIIINSSDRMIIATFLGLSGTGIYTNYVFITSNLGSFMGIFINSISASVGNYSASESKESIYNLLHKVLLINFTIGLFVSQLYTFLVQPFISEWAGVEFIENISFPLILGFHFILMRMKEVIYTFKHNMGILEKDQIRPLIEALLNILLSILLVKKYGITGVVLGTVLSFLIISFFWEPYVFLKHANLNDKIFDFFKFYVYYVFQYILILVSNYFIIHSIRISNNYIAFIVNAIIVFIITLFLYYIFNIKNSKLKDVLIYLVNTVRRVKHEK